MNPRYQPGGDIYAKVQAQYGTAGAERVALADRSSTGETVAEALGYLKSGSEKLDDSTASIFWGQITTDPLAAPLESANNQLNNVVKNVFKNVWVLIVVIILLGWGAWKLGLFRFKTRKI